MRPIIISAVMILVSSPCLKGQNASEIVQKAYEKMMGKTSYSKMEMKIIRPGWDRTIRFKSWSKGTCFPVSANTAWQKPEL